MRRRKLVRKALLIQSILEFQAVMQPFVYDAIVSINAPYTIQERALKWIIAEELELCRGLFEVNHIHNDDPYAWIHNRVGFTMAEAGWTSLSQVFCAYVRAPPVYDDENEVLLEIKPWGDMYLTYYSQTMNLPFY